MHYTLEPIGLIRSPYQEKFGIPRQPALAPSAPVTLELLPPYNQPDCVRGLEDFSHVWLTFVFHDTLARGWQPLVRPPRLGGNSKVGVFASRATHRPNGLGLSLVELKGVDTRHGVTLQLAGADLLDGTPVLDIKPYIPFVESLPDAYNRIAEAPPPLLQVEWQADALTAARQHARRLGEPLVQLIEQCLAQDPKPAYQKPEPSRQYGARLHDVNVVWCYPEPARILVLAVE